MENKVKVFLSFWYDLQTQKLLIAEFSFDYDEAFAREMIEKYFHTHVLLEDYPLDLVKDTKLLFRAIQDDTAVDIEGTTKTAFAYEDF